MALTASSDATLSAGSLVLIACFSALCLVSGLRHYRGHGTWLLSWLPSGTSFFTPAWFGACGLMVVLSEIAGHVSVVFEGLLAIPTLVLLAITLVSLVWLPPRMLPAWYRGRRPPRPAARAIR